MRRSVWCGAVALALIAALVPGSPAPAAPVAFARRAELLPPERLSDNTAVSDDTRPAEADFDGFGAYLSARDLTAAGWTPGRTLTARGRG